MVAHEVSASRQLLIDYLGSFGLVPRNMKADGWGEDGFIEVNPITGEESADRIPWPEGFNYDWFKVLVPVADISDYSRLTRSQYLKAVNKTPL